MLNFLVLGSGGREHAFAWKLAQSSEINKCGWFSLDEIKEKQLQKQHKNVR